MTSRTGTRHIIVGIDGSPQSRRALEWAVNEEARPGDRIDAVHAYGSGLAWIDVGSDAEALILARSAELARETLAGAIDAAAIDAGASDTWAVPVNSVVVEGEAARVLVELAEHADLLVVGSRGRGGFAGLLLGSVSQRCAERSPCPVVVVPSPEA